MAITDKGKKTLIRLFVVIVLVVGFFGLRYAAGHGYGKKYLPAFMVPKVTLDDSKSDATSTGATFDGLPSTTVANLPADAPEIRINFWAWNSQMGCEYANGGPITTEGSLMAKQGIRMIIDRQDDNNQMMSQLVALAKGMHDGDVNTKAGVHFIGIMGDGAPTFLAAVNKQLEDAYGADYRAEIIGSCGYSRGEDKIMGPKEWRDNPQSMRGSLVAAVIRDGDWDIHIRYAADNNVPVNPDETTYDPDAINFVNTSSFTDAAEKYVQGYCEDRKVVKNGKPTGETKHVCVQGADTWTPGDVTMAKKKGGVVSVVSTKQYTNEMPHVIIGIHKWDQAHRDAVQKMLTAFLEGGNQVINYPKALDRAAEIAQAINKESGADASYWKKYYLGTVEPDINDPSLQVELGGSKADNLADDLLLFGLSSGATPATSRFAATYNTFGSIQSKMYPKLVPSVPPLDSILDLSYLRVVSALAGSNTGTAEAVTYNSADTISKVVGRRGYSIEFATGSAELTPSGKAQLDKLARELTLSNLIVNINGHTDNTGSDVVNQQLSQSRAMAVKNYLETNYPSAFPQGRISKVTGLGASVPLQPNTTEAGRRANRRVEIIIGQ